MLNEHFTRQVSPGVRPSYYRDQMTLNLVTGDCLKRGYDPLNQFYWSDENIAVIRESLLMDTLRNLTDGRASSAKQDAMEWLESNESEPFSFKTCCNELGLDHLEVRSRVLYLIQKLEKALDRKKPNPELKKTVAQIEAMKLFQ